jgi:hypothetical protein
LCYFVYYFENFSILHQNGSGNTFFKLYQNGSGNTLVICCEGNAGYYEIGCTMTPLEGGYSILAWNHPGFGGKNFSKSLFNKK